MAFILVLSWCVQLAFSQPTGLEVIPYSVVFRIPVQKCPGLDKDWNVDPTKIAIDVNPDNALDGPVVNIQYMPGLWPWFRYLDNSSTEAINGGLPQSSNMEAHLKALEKNYKTYPHRKDSSYAVVSFQKWRPIWRENYRWDRLIYQTASTMKILRDPALSLNQTRIRSLAVVDFESHAIAYFKNTLVKIKQLTNNKDSRVGFMGYPSCYNSNNVNRSCSVFSQQNNIQLIDMFTQAHAFYPTIFIPDPASYNAGDDVSKDLFVRVKVAEARKMAKRMQVRPLVMPIISYYYSGTDRIMSRKDMTRVLVVPCESGADGVILFGKSHLLDSQNECKVFREFYHDVMEKSVMAAHNCSLIMHSESKYHNASTPA